MVDQSKISGAVSVEVSSEHFDVGACREACKIGKRPILDSEASGTRQRDWNGSPPGGVVDQGYVSRAVAVEVAGNRCHSRASRQTSKDGSGLILDSETSGIRQSDWHRGPTSGTIN